MPRKKKEKEVHPGTSSFSTSLDLENGIINIYFKDVIGKILPSKYKDSHIYNISLLRQALVDLVAHLYLSGVIYDVRKTAAEEKPIGKLEFGKDVENRMKYILETWLEKRKKEELENENRGSGEVSGDDLPNVNGKVSQNRES